MSAVAHTATAAAAWPANLPAHAYTYDALVSDAETIDMRGIARLLGVSYSSVLSWRPNYKHRKVKINPADGPHPQLLPPELPDLAALVWRRGAIMEWAMQVGRWDFDNRVAVKQKPPGRPPTRRA